MIYFSSLYSNFTVEMIYVNIADAQSRLLETMSIRLYIKNIF